MKLVLGAWPKSEAGPFPTLSVAFRAVHTALASTLPHSILRGYEGEVVSVAISGDGTRIVSGGDYGTIQLWRNLPPGNILQVACRHLPVINDRPDTSADGLAAEIGIEGLTLPDDCDQYDAPLPPEFRR